MEKKISFSRVRQPQHSNTKKKEKENQTQKLKLTADVVKTFMIPEYKLLQAIDVAFFEKFCKCKPRKDDQFSSKNSIVHMHDKKDFLIPNCFCDLVTEVFVQELLSALFVYIDVQWMRSKKAIETTFHKFTQLYHTVLLWH